MITAVTGATGHVGGTLVRTLLERGHRVRALVRGDLRALEGLDAERVPGDLRDPASLERAFAGADVVVHSAAHISLLRTDARLVEAVNVAGTGAVIAACRAAGVDRLVHFSSIHALQQRPLGTPVDEDRPLVDERPNARRIPPYDRSKAAGERLAREAAGDGLEVVILNPTGMIGPYDFKPSLFGRVLLALARGRLPALIDGGFDWVDVRDVAASAATVAGTPAADRVPGGAGAGRGVDGAGARRYLLPGRWASLAEVAGIVAAVTGIPAPRWAAPQWAARAGAPVATAAALAAGRQPLFTGVSLAALRGNRRVSGVRAAAELGHRPRGLADTVRETVSWFAEHGMLAEARR
jgi:dihydroflavonol-4-reductase